MAGEAVWELPVTVIVEGPVGVVALVVIFKAEVHVFEPVPLFGVQKAGLNVPVTPKGNPEPVKLTAAAVPESFLTVTKLDTDEPWITLLFPSLVRLNEKGAVIVTEQLAVFEMPELVTVTVAFFTPALAYVEVVDWVEPLASPDQRYVYDPLGGVKGLTDASHRIVFVAGLVTVPLQEGVKILNGT